MTTRINYVTQAGETVASYRMRIDTPRQVINNLFTDYECLVSREYDDMADINIFSKHWNAEKDAQDIFGAESKTIFDVCDDHFDREMGPYYEFMCLNADTITCNTASMQERIYQVTGRLARIVNDPVTFPRQQFEFSPTPKFLWFGGRVNLPSLSPIIHKLPNLTIICDLVPDILPEHVTGIQWQPNLVEDMIEDFDIVVLPRNDYPWALTKSPNRLVDALNAGKFVITDFPEVYGEFEPYCFVGDIESGVNHYLEYGQHLEDMIQSGQEYVERNYLPRKIAKDWVEIFELTLDEQEPEYARS